MRHTISPDRQTLTITVDHAERAELSAWDNPDKGIQSDAAMHDFLEPLICNSELDWINPEETSDLTDAPILGTRDDQGEVTERWAFMDYQVRSVLEELRDKGTVNFIC